VIAVMVVGVLGVGIGAVVLPGGKSGPPHPSRWDARVLDIVAFDEQHRGLTYEHPVFVDFVSPDEYSKRTRAEQSALTPEDKSQLAAAEAELRALGLATGSVDLFSAGNDLADNGTLAFYDPDTERVTVRGTELTVDVRVTLTHELTHVLQDQHFNIKASRIRRFTTSGEREAFRAVVEGDAVRIENEYVASLTEEEKAEYRSATRASVDSTKKSLQSVPVALQALQGSPYIFGPRLLELVKSKGGVNGINEALRSPPSTEEQLLDPRAYFGHDGAKPVEPPALPDGVKESTDSGDFGALSWLLVLGERIDPAVALTAADGWGGDAYTSFVQDGRGCIRIAFSGDTGQDTTEMHDALNQWVALMPSGAASVTEDSAGVLLQSCDPGKDSGLVLNNRALDLIAIPAIREEVMLSGLRDGGLDVDKAFAFGDCFIRRPTFEQITALSATDDGSVSPELTQVLQNVSATCTNQIS
jgi:hypothetical protein